MINIPQIYCTVVVSCIGLTLGTSIGWAALIPKMEKDKDLPYELWVEDIRWLGNFLDIESYFSNFYCICIHIYLFFNNTFPQCFQIPLTPSRMFPVWDFVLGIFAREALLNMGWVLSTLNC